MQRIGRGAFRMDDARIIGTAAVVGRKEGEGPLGLQFDKILDDDTFGADSWEKAESALIEAAVELCLSKCNLQDGDPDVVFTGDLLNQCVASTFGLREKNIPQMGVYGACSTMASSLINAAVFAECCAAGVSLAATSSHFSSSQRQFRTPLTYGGQRTPTAQWTVTGAGAAAVGREGSVKITAAQIGTMVDLGVTDPSNMGAAMAPAAAQTIQRILTNTDMNPGDFHMILTGDLGAVGGQLLLELLEKDKIIIEKQHRDCGMLIYDNQKQDTHAGGSGCGCSASVLCGSVIPAIERGEIGRVLFVATGALMSTTSSQQGESIPGIAHAVILEK
ncbi:MAG: stage V sporulation protein AD [Oscillospiraceae bacterium]|nr:stage V sporulation protein AD [Oscillospiraceae bacterium]